MAQSFNSVQLMGNLTRDPELRYTPGGVAVCSFSIAVSERFKKGEEWQERTHFFEITTWAGTAENVAKHKKKGDPVFVAGRLVHETWNDKNGGGKRSMVKVVAERVVYLNRSSGPPGGGGAAAGGGRDRDDGPPPDYGSEDDIPF